MVVARGIDHKERLEMSVDEAQRAPLDVRLDADHETVRRLAHYPPEFKRNFRRRKVSAGKIPQWRL
jgi:hypothetical protein